MRSGSWKAIWLSRTSYQVNLRNINKSQALVVFTVALLFSMTIYHNGHFRDLFSYYEHAGEKTYDIGNDGWTVDLSSQFEMADEFDLMLKNIDNYEYPANSIIVVNKGKIVDTGTHQELLKNSAIYSNLYSKQLSAN